MNFSLTPQLEQFIRDQAESGRYNNASEVVREALRLLRNTEEERQLKMARLREAIQVGRDDIANGDCTKLANPTNLDKFFEEL